MGNIQIFKFFLAVFFAGVASLQLELSILREASFIFGSTAFTNSFIISVFLAGLAIGSYSGNILVRVTNGKASELFIISQAFSIALVLFFISTKGYILYGKHPKLLSAVYFGCVTIVPAIVAGMAFALFLHLLYGSGEKFIALVYAISTVGNVIGGLVHGIILIPYFGMMSTYLIAITTTGLAILLIIPFRIRKSSLIALFVIAACITLFKIKSIPEATAKSLLWSKDDLYGLVEVYDRSNLWDGWRGGKGIDIFVHNRHNCANSEYDINWHKTSVINSMDLQGNNAQKVLILGYCSGITHSKLLEYPSIKKITTIELNRSIMEASSIFFPGIYKRNQEDKRSVIVIDEFRTYLRNRPENEKFDIVILDITIDDPYFLGILTIEFFESIKTHLSSSGVVFFHKPEFMRTAAEVFEHIYLPINPYSKKWFFCKINSISANQEKYFHEIFPKKSPGLVYADHKIYERGERIHPIYFKFRY